jgi:uncharacterized protein YfaS (alpha-2-macroglobulin family)
MKTFIIAFSILVGIISQKMADNNYNYEKAWQEVEKLISNGLPKSAFDKVEEILSIADKEKNNPQIAKAAIYIARLSIQTNEDGIEIAIRKLSEIINNHEGPVKHIIASYLAELYQKYFENYRWEISQRTEIAGTKGTDFRTWTTLQFMTTIESWYLYSIENKQILSDNINDYTPILNNFPPKYNTFRPTLYEVLTDRVLTYFEQFGNYTTTNPESFEISSPVYFDPAQNYINEKIQSNDSLSASYKILMLYKAMLKLQMATGNRNALADYDLKRLQYVYNYSTVENKNELYIKSLNTLAGSNENIDFHTEIASTLARQIINETNDTTANVKALNICNDAIAKHPASSGAAKCKQIVQEIKSPDIRLFAEQVYPSKNHILLAIDYKNVKSVKIETVKLAKDYFDLSKKGNQESIRSYLKNAKKIYQSVINLKVSPLYKTQRIEFDHPSLPYGQYATIVSSNEKGAEVFQYILYNVSDLSYTTYKADKERVFLVRDRVKGHPLKNIKVSLFAQNYNPLSRSFDFNQIKTMQTDAFGKVILSDNTDRNYKVILEKGKDILDLNQFHYNNVHYENSEVSFAELFTDRSIYRPGQVVYYKAILLKNDKNLVPSILPAANVDVVFRDANYQEISRHKKTSNDFGSIDGTFTIPTGKLNGKFTVEIISPKGISGNTSVLVEEYKRPTFEVKVNPLKNDFKLFEKIIVTGSAQMLAGSNVDGATVSYKVVRNARFPDWGWWWRMPVQRAEFIVKTGQALTDIDGKFTIDFEAIPDKTVPLSDKPVFAYTVEIDVTDQRGETRSGTTTVAIGYAAFALSANLNGELDVDNLKHLKISASGSSGQTVSAKGTVNIVKLQEPSIVKINKYWEGKTDIPLIKSSQQKYFPYYKLPFEHDFSTWGVEREVFAGKFDTADSINITSFIQAGVYKLLINSVDKDGGAISNTQYVIVTNFNKKSFPKSDFLFARLNNEVFEPGDLLKLSLGAPDKTIHAHTIIEKDGKIISDKTIKVEKYAELELLLTEVYRGGINIKISYNIQNRLVEKSLHVNIPWTNKQLDISYETFRDKVMPGAPEEYKIRIKGLNKDKIAAEMIASMYDASLDQFAAHHWRKDFYPESYSVLYLESPGFTMVSGMYYYYGNNDIADTEIVIYPALLPLIDYYAMYGNVMAKTTRARAGQAPEMAMMDSAPIASQAKQAEIPAEVRDTGSKKDKGDGKSNEIIPVRKNLKETVFFFPDLKTDTDGNIVLSFTFNEALTKWKLMSFAHTKDFKTGYDERFVQTQKNLMIFPNAPRFLRDGDIFSFSAKVTNLLDKNTSAIATLQLFDAITNKDITNELVKSPTTLQVNIEKSGSTGIKWDLTIPESKYIAVTYSMTARAGDHTDGEENTIPVVTNNFLVTESMPMWLKGNETKSFTFNAFKNNLSQTKKDFAYTIEYTSNPVWYAIQALPYINASNNESTQSVIDRLYANTLASEIANAHPKIKSVFDLWQTQSKDALLSNLAKNETLKSALLEETPWVAQSLSESEQKGNIALLFDINKLGNEKKVAITKLAERQLPNGGFPWISGGRDDVYTTQNLMESIGHLYYLGALNINDPDLTSIISMALKYMDEELVRRYQRIQDNIKLYGGNINDDHLDELSVQYLYVRTFFRHVNLQPVAVAVKSYYFGQAKKYWLKSSLSNQAMIGLVLLREDDKEAQSILKSLRQKSFANEELGIYWNEGNGFYWYQLPIERHALMIELFTESGTGTDETDKMKIWLLKNKQTNHWKTSKATIAALYALLRIGNDKGISKWVTESAVPEITAGKENLIITSVNSEAGTGYFKKSYSGQMLGKDMADIKITNKNKSVAWGAAYYQYFEQLDKVKIFEATPLKIIKKLYKINRTGKGDILAEIGNNTILNPGDKVKIRIELRVDREMEYVLMKDMRASGFEPVNIISGYKYQGQLGYYEATKDVGTNFYFSYLPKGTFVFEYEVKAVHKGDFSAGITSIESMYAPEFRSHSEGTRLKVQ